MTNEQLTINFEPIGTTLVKCNIDPGTCPARKIRPNPYLTITQHMCTHDDAPKVKEESLTKTGFNFRTCVTK